MYIEERKQNIVSDTSLVAKINGEIQDGYEKELLDTNDISDGNHTFGELYDHRAVLFMMLCKCFRRLAWKSKYHSDGTMFDNMFIVGIDTPKGQATYHYYKDLYWDDFDVTELERAPEWDGHSSTDVLDRLISLEKLITGQF